MNTSESRVSDILQRLHLATLGAARRTQVQIMHDLDRLKTQSKRQKSARWLNESAWLVDTLRADAMNGVDIILIAGDADPHEVQEYQSKIKATGTYARAALFSAASPLNCARNFSRQASPFILLCADVAMKLEEIVHSDNLEEKLTTLYRARPSQSQGQDPDGTKD